jgi:phospholipid/cholesterol/gamma-HCH transport system substrate-binding protein
MQKQAPTFGRLATMVAFALSCFGLLLFLWLSFGGAIPLKPQGYQVKVAVPNATQLGLEADVRVAGISVGKVVQKDLAGGPGNDTIATVQLDNRFAPLRSDAHAILRQKTLLGETYLELTPGTKNAPAVPDGGSLAPANVADAVTLDQIFGALDPVTRQAFRTWQTSLQTSIQGQGPALNDALGNLPGFVQSGNDLFTVLDERKTALQQLLVGTGTVFAALTRSESQLHNLVTGSAATFSATASQNVALAQTFQIFPTFLDESKATLARLRTFALDADPLIQELTPAIHDLTPTLHNVRLLAPDLRNFFTNLGPLITASKTGLPALRDTLNGLTPLLAQLDPFLAQLNPILQWLEYNQPMDASFISPGIGGVTATESSQSGGIGHYLRQFGPTGSGTISLSPTRGTSDRGNAYPYGANLAGPAVGSHLIMPNHDCNNTTNHGEQQPHQSTSPADPSVLGCFVQGPAPGYPTVTSPGAFFPTVPADNYDKGARGG